MFTPEHRTVVKESTLLEGIGKSERTNRTIRIKPKKKIVLKNRTTGNNNNVTEDRVLGTVN